MLELERLRVHHMLCIPLFAGEGYSDGFSRNMARKIAWLKKHKEAAVFLTAGPDMICGCCPKLSQDHTCTDGRDGVRRKDLELAAVLDLETERIYSFRELFSSFERGMTEEIFVKSCRNCRWFQMGLCDYKTYRENIRLYDKYA